MEEWRRKWLGDARMESELVSILILLRWLVSNSKHSPGGVSGSVALVRK
jgi:hypothetical protein